MTQTIFKPRSPGNGWGYWKVENLLDLPEHTKRHRKEISFILTNEGLKRFINHYGANPTCVHCRKGIDDNDKVKPYGSYNPRTKRAKLWHYECGWGALLSDIIIDER